MYLENLVIQTTMQDIKYFYYLRYLFNEENHTFLFHTEKWKYPISIKGYIHRASRTGSQFQAVVPLEPLNHKPDEDLSQMTEIWNPNPNHHHHLSEESLNEYLQYCQSKDINREDEALEILYNKKYNIRNAKLAIEKMQSPLETCDHYNRILSMDINDISGLRSTLVSRCTCECHSRSIFI